MVILMISMRNFAKILIANQLIIVGVCSEIHGNIREETIDFFHRISERDKYLDLEYITPPKNLPYATPETALQFISNIKYGGKRHKYFKFSITTEDFSARFLLTANVVEDQYLKKLNYICTNVVSKCSNSYRNIVTPLIENTGGKTGGFDIPNEKVKNFATNVLRILKRTTSTKKLCGEIDEKNAAIETSAIILTSERLRSEKSLSNAYIELYKLKHDPTKRHLEDLFLDKKHTSLVFVNSADSIRDLKIHGKEFSLVKLFIEMVQYIKIDRPDKIQKKTLRKMLEVFYRNKLTKLWRIHQLEDVNSIYKDITESIFYRSNFYYPIKKILSLWNSEVISEKSEALIRKNYLTRIGYFESAEGIEINEILGCILEGRRDIIEMFFDDEGLPPESRFIVANLISDWNIVFDEACKMVNPSHTPPLQNVEILEIFDHVLDDIINAEVKLDSEFCSNLRNRIYSIAEKGIKKAQSKFRHPRRNWERDINDLRYPALRKIERLSTQ